MFCITCVYWMLKHLEENKAKDWLKCPVFMAWFHKECFQWLTHLIYYTIKLSNGQKMIRYVVMVLNSLFLLMVLDF